VGNGSASDSGTSKAAAGMPMTKLVLVCVMYMACMLAGAWVIFMRPTWGGSGDGVSAQIDVGV